MTDLPDLRYVTGAQLDELMQAKRTELARLHDQTLQTLAHEQHAAIATAGRQIIADAQERAREIIAEAEQRAAAISQRGMQS